MRQGFSEPTQKNKFLSFAGGEERFYKQRIDKEKNQVRDYLKIIAKLEKLTSQKGHMLEIGCAMGVLLNEIRNRGWKVTGIEPEEWTCKIARERYGLNVINKPFQEAGLEESSFDAILMLHVIEHLPDPAKGLSQIARMIKPGGHLVLETPRFDTLWFKLLRGRERSVISGHLYYFTGKTMRDLASKAQLEVVLLESVGRTVTIDRLCFYLAKFLDFELATKALTSISDFFHLNKLHIKINLRDMMRVYLRRTN
jgi:2-polyprenyl-3-methyl-5-hydroxy-6-metoxy-1,4-benzoquinol methylase